MKKSIYAIALMLLLVILTLLKLYHPALQKESPKTGPPKSNKAVSVDINIVKEIKLDQSLSASGNFVAKESVRLASEISGKIQFINFKQGTVVNKGQLLVKLNDEELKAELKKLELEEKIASDKEDRKKKLLEIKGISLNEYEEALYELEMVRANKTILQTKIAKTEIRAPFTGLLGLQSISPGTMVNPGTELISLVQMDPIYIDFYLPEDMTGHISNDVEINFISGNSNSRHTAKLVAIENTIDQQTRSIKIRTIADNGKGLFKPGAFAKIQVTPGKDRTGLLVPNTCLIPVLKGYRVYLIKEGKVVEREVKTGIKNELNTVITDGINVGDSLIVSGMMNLKPGAVVNVNTIKEDE